MVEAAGHPGDSACYGLPSANAGRWKWHARPVGRRREMGVKRVYVRIRDEDRLLLEARAAARGMRPATYVPS